MRHLVGSRRVGRPGVTSSAAKSGEIPALSRNGDALSGDEPGRLPRRRESSPSDEGRFVRLGRRGSFVLRSASGGRRWQQRRRGLDRHGDRSRAAERARIGAMLLTIAGRECARLGDLRARDPAASLPLRRPRRRHRRGDHRVDAWSAPRVRRGSHRGDRQLDAQADGRRRAPARHGLLLRARALERDHGGGGGHHDRGEGGVQGAW